MSKNIILLICLILAVSMAEGARLGATSKNKLDEVTLQCDEGYGVQAGDNCEGIIQTFGMSEQQFTAINPNLVCDNLFAGQWVCTLGEFGS